MLPKPDGCLACPMAQDMLGWVPDETIPGARVTVFLQNPGETEVHEGKPAVGASGHVLDTTLLPRAGLTRGKDVNVCNTLRCRWQGTNNLPPAHILNDAVKRCRQYDPPKTELIVAAGALPWRTFVPGAGSVMDWRGFALDGVLATLHPADLFRDPKMRLVVMNDWTKVRAYLNGTWPEPIPPYVKIPQDVRAGDFNVFVDAALQGAPFVAMDTEYGRDSRILTCIGIGYPGAKAGIQIWMHALNPVDRAEIRESILRLIGGVPTVFQNAFADIPILERNLGIPYAAYKHVEDTMLEHAVLWSDWPHTLEFLASMYGKYAKMKHLSQSDPSLYNWGDVIDTISAHQALRSEFARDEQARSIYETQSLPLIPIILKRQKLGIRVNKARVAPAIEQYNARLKEASLLARAYAGWPINVGSDHQLKVYLYDYLGLPIQKNKDTKKASTDGDAISVLRQYIGPEPDLELEEMQGLGVPAGQDRVESGANGVLEARVIYAAARQVLSHYLNPLLEHRGAPKERIYPDFKIHAQASGRWSTTDPPLAQLPEDLRDIICPDPGMAWIAYDSDQIELRLLAALANDEPYLEAFANGQDVHTLNARAIFDDPTITQSDPRRVFAKRFVYRLNYGGNPRGAGNIPGAKQLGLNGSKLVDASSRYLAAHPAMARWREGVAVQVRSTGVSRTFMGRRRRLLSTGPAALREAYNHPLQGSAADVLNTTVIAIHRRLAYATMVYTMHDACTWEVPEAKVSEAAAVIKAIAEQPWDVNGVKVVIPVKMKPVIYGT